MSEGSRSAGEPAPQKRPAKHRRLAVIAGRIAAIRRQLPGRDRLLGGFEQGAMAAVAALLAYLPTRAIGLREGFWAAITAIAVTQIKFEATRDTARDQFTGAAVGGLIGGIAASLGERSLVVYGLAVLLAISCCWLLRVASAARLAGTTVTIVVLVPHGGTVVHVLVARVSEVAWGVTVALCVVGLTDWAVRHWVTPQAPDLTPSTEPSSSAPPSDRPPANRT